MDEEDDAKDESEYPEGGIFFPDIELILWRRLINHNNGSDKEY